MDNQVSILPSAAVVVDAFEKVEEDSNQFTAIMTICKKNDSNNDNRNNEVFRPWLKNVKSGARGNYVWTQGEGNRKYLDAINHFNSNLFVQFDKFHDKRT